MERKPSRKSDRSRVRMRATVSYNGIESRGSVIDLSPEGLKIYVSNDLRAVPGRQISVQTEEIGLLTGIVRWARHPTIGVELALSTNTRAKIESFYKAFASERERR